MLTFLGLFFRISHDDLKFEANVFGGAWILGCYQFLYNGLLLKSFSVCDIQIEGVIPTVVEVKKFREVEAKVTTQMNATEPLVTEVQNESRDRIASKIEVSAATAVSNKRESRSEMINSIELKPKDSVTMRISKKLKMYKAAGENVTALVLHTIKN